MKGILSYWRKKKLENGKRIKITWLPKNNAHPRKNCYIGGEGVVECFDDEGFVLRYDSGAILIVHGKFDFEYI
jgi:hypothetical protein